MVNRRQFLMAGTAGAIALAMASANDAVAQQDWPEKPVSMVVPFPPGGTADMLGRMVSRHLSDAFKQPFVVENRAGAGGLIGSQQVARSVPDGYTLVVSGLGSHVIAPDASNAFDPMKDFTHIAMLGGQPAVLVMNSAGPVKDLKGFIDYANAHPDGASWGSPGRGTHGHLIGELFKADSKLNMVHISYKGAAPAVGDLLGNHIQAAFVALSTAGPHIKSGKLRGIAVASEKRSASYPDVPTFAELGYPKLTGTSWFSLSGPAGLPQTIVHRLNAEVRRAFSSPEVRAQLAKEGIETSAMDATAFTEFFKSEIDFWTPYAKALRKEK